MLAVDPIRGWSRKPRSFARTCWATSGSSTRSLRTARPVVTAVAVVVVVVAAVDMAAGVVVTPTKAAAATIGMATTRTTATATATDTTATTAIATTTRPRREPVRVRRPRHLHRPTLPPRLPTMRRSTRSTTVRIRTQRMAATRRTSRCTSSGQLPKPVKEVPRELQAFLALPAPRVPRRLLHLRRRVRLLRLRPPLRLRRRRRLHRGRRAWVDTAR